MHKLVLVFSVIIGLFDNNYSKIEKIEYRNFQNDNEYIYLNIAVSCYIRDIITLKVKNNEDYFESSLIIEGKKETLAKIPFKVTEKSYLNINVKSENRNVSLIDIEFPVYPKNNSICDLNKTNYCKSKYPSKVIYENGNINEYYEQISLNMKSTNLFSFNNLIPVKDISFYTLNFESGDAYLHLNKKIDSLNIYYDKGYTFPLNIIKSKNTINFEFFNNYYLDVMEGKTYENYEPNTRIDSNVLLPYTSDVYEIKLVIYDSNSFSKVFLKFNVITKGNMIGNNDSKYTLKRGYL